MHGHAGPPMQGGGRGRGRRGGYVDSDRMGDRNGLAFGFDAGIIPSHAVIFLTCKNDLRPGKEDHSSCILREGSELKRKLPHEAATGHVNFLYESFQATEYGLVS